MKDGGMRKSGMVFFRRSSCRCDAVQNGTFHEKARIPRLSVLRQRQNFAQYQLLPIQQTKKTVLQVQIRCLIRVGREMYFQCQEPQPIIFGDNFR